MKEKQMANIPNSRLFTKRKKELRIGIIFPGYGYERVSYSMSLPDFDFKRLHTIPLHRVITSSRNFLKETPLVIAFGVDLLHTWNALPISTKPFVVSFESELPRYLGNPSLWQMDYGFNLLHSKKCRKILALSNAAKNNFIAKCMKEGFDNLINKVEVFRGSVDIPVAKKEIYFKSGPLQLLFVGTDAIAKGIVPLLNALEELNTKGMDIHLTFIGGFSRTGYVHGEFIPDVDEIVSRIKTYSWVDFKGRIPIEDVFKEMKKHDVLAFPTFDESLGWVPIEAGLLGVPTIATDIFALPELIAHKETGYLIRINKRKDRRFVGLNTSGNELAKHLDDANSLIEKGLMAVIQGLYENRDKIEQWGRAAELKLSAMYSPDLAKNQLTKIYNDALHVD